MSVLGGDIHSYLRDRSRDEEKQYLSVPEPSIKPQNKMLISEGPDQRPEKSIANLPNKVTPGGHVESSVKIFFTKQYDRFVRMKGNRVLNKIKINRIKRDIENGLDVLKYCPVIVSEKDGKLEIIDGQHRYEVAKEMGSHVWYIIADELTLLEIAKVNSNTEKWKNKDYIHCYASQGNEHYQQLSDFMEKYGFPLSVSLALLTKGAILTDGGGDLKKVFQAGTFTVADLPTAINIAETVMRFEGFEAAKSRTFVVAICKVIESGQCPIDEVIEAYIDNKAKLEPQSSWKEYLGALEAIVNIGKKIRRVIY